MHVFTSPVRDLSRARVIDIYHLFCLFFVLHIQYAKSSEKNAGIFCRHIVIELSICGFFFLSSEVKKQPSI